jgi:Holliday junction resolvase RusA-like endonuclease
MIFSVDLPMPMSVNNLFFNVPGKGRVKTMAYENWQQVAIKEIWAQVRADRRIGGKVAITILLPRKCRLDIDNACKPLLDALVHSKRIDDDRHVERLTVMRGHPGETVNVTVQAFA